jgi:hypothetical protein
VKASQALSSEIVLPRLIERLMTIALENAGAVRGPLILPSADEHLIQADARATGDQIEVTMRQEPIARATCPESLVRYVILGELLKKQKVQPAGQQQDPRRRRQPRPRRAIPGHRRGGQDGHGREPAGYFGRYEEEGTGRRFQERRP